jgi:hypothetical protein
MGHDLITGAIATGEQRHVNALHIKLNYEAESGKWGIKC